MNKPFSSPSGPSSGPLRGVKFVEFAGMGPGPSAAMLLADMGADIIRIERPDAPDELISPIADRKASRTRGPKKSGSPSANILFA